jgi:hypothetical protein
MIKNIFKIKLTINHNGYRIKTFQIGKQKIEGIYIEEAAGLVTIEFGKVLNLIIYLVYW